MKKTQIELMNELDDKFPQLFPQARVTILVKGRDIKETIGFDLEKGVKLSDALREIANTMDAQDRGELKEITDLDGHLRKLQTVDEFMKEKTDGKNKA